MKLALVPLLTALAAMPPAVPQNSGEAQKPKREIQEVRATGCVSRGAEKGCLLLRTLDGKTTYHIFANPEPESGVVITIEGKAHQGPDTCRQGIPVDLTNWQATGEKCVR